MTVDNTFEVEVNRKRTVLDTAYIYVTEEEYKELLEDPNYAVMVVNDQDAEWDEAYESELIVSLERQPTQAGEYYK